MTLQFKMQGRIYHLVKHVFVKTLLNNWLGTEYPSGKKMFFKVLKFPIPFIKFFKLLKEF